MLNDEILTGYSITEFLESEMCGKWTEETRHSYANCLQDLLEYVQQNGTPSRELLAAWKEHLQQGYGRTSVNVHMAAANNYFRWCNRYDLLSGYAKAELADEKEIPALTRAEYHTLLRTARGLGEYRSYLLIKLFATTDLPLQCLDQITVELVSRGRGVLLSRGSAFNFSCPASLQKELMDYILSTGIDQGPVFVTRSGQPLNRVHIFRNLQKLCRAAGVPEEKGNPRSLRNLYKAAQKQIDDRLLALKGQMYDQLLEMEQESIGWKNEGKMVYSHIT